MTPAEPYLVAHIVRGEPAFDIAIRCDDMGTESDPGPWWIIPTSGHRAYPYWHRTLEMFMFAAREENPLEFVPPDWPDHYQTYAAKGQGLIANLAERLGLV